MAAVRVLLVEDSEDDAALVVRELQRAGFAPAWKRVDTRAGMEAALRSATWDVVVSDYAMPKFSGPEALATLKAAGVDVPFIIVSGTIGEELAVEAMRSGAQDYILKDRLVRLPAAVARELREAELRRAHAKSEEMLSETRERLDSAMQMLLQAEKLAALGELVAGVAHEINNPLSSVMGYTQLLLARDLPPEVQRRLEIVHSEAERMGRIVKNLLTFARKHPPEKKYLGLNGIIEKTLDLKTYHFRVNQIRIHKDLDPELPKTMLDFQQIQQVLLNLLNNAEQAILEAGRAGAIGIRTRVALGRIEVRVTDDGPGVPADIRFRIFEPFFTTKKEGKGTGLGLSLCYGIVQEHGGTLRLEGGTEPGAAFVVELPVVPENELSEDRPSAGASAAPPGLRILVIDDESTVQSLLVEILRSKGYGVDTASDAPEAFQKIEADGHDLIICDMKMPRGSGRDVYQAVLGRDPRLAKRIIFTTGDGANADTNRFIQETGNIMVTKPFLIEDIEKAIAGASDR